MNDYQLHLLEHRQRHQELVKQREAEALHQVAREARRRQRSAQPVPVRVTILNRINPLKRSLANLLNFRRSHTVPEGW